MLTKISPKMQNLGQSNWKIVWGVFWKSFYEDDIQLEIQVPPWD